jgi:hypothetical protein
MNVVNYVRLALAKPDLGVAAHDLSLCRTLSGGSGSHQAASFITTVLAPG